MKRNKVTLAVFLAALSLFAAPSASAIPQAQVSTIKKTVAEVPAAELAAKAADLVVQATESDRLDVALATVREIASKRSATIVSVVGAIAKAAPELSAAVAAEATKLVAEQATAIAKAAASAAPAQADQIASAVAKVAPKFATKVTRAVAIAVPEQTHRIVDSVIASVPASRVEIQSDATITRLSQRMSDTPGSNGTFSSRPGSISGKPVPNTPPVDVGTPVVGADDKRGYQQP